MTMNDLLETTETTRQRKRPDWFKITVLIMLGFIVLHLLYLDWVWWTIRDAANDLGNELQNIEPPSPEEIWPTEGGTG